jgi:hypothetical protein
VHKYLRFLFAMLTVMIAMGVVAGTAAALRSLSVAGPTTLTLNSRRLTFESPFVRIECEVTLVKTISRVIPKTEGILIGKVTDVRIDAPRCVASNGARVTITPLGLGVEELWRLFYKSILGTLPRITGARFRIERLQVLLEIGGVNCLFQGFVEGLALISSGVVGNLRTLRPFGTTQSLALGPNEERLRNNFFCPSTEISFQAEGVNGELVPLQRITISLI